jgi:large subunit ribosomal protein L4
MANVTTYTKSGSKAATSATLDKSVFDVEITHHELLKQAYTTYLSNGRLNLAKTKTRGDVRGGGKKPWRQKGTGRARFGSSRVPIWRGGGIALGPTGNENYTRKINIKAKRVAIRQALTLAAQGNQIIVMEDLSIKDGKTKEMIQLLGKIEATTGSTLLVVENKTEDLMRSTNNIQGIKVVQANYLSVYDILNADRLVVTAKALDVINEWLGEK